MSENSDFNVRYTNKDIMEMLQRQEIIQQEILAHAKITNGRVTSLEETSTGMWIRRNPFKFAVIVVMFVLIFISDLRHPMMDLIFKLV